VHLNANRSTIIERDEVKQLLHCFNVFPSAEKLENIYNFIDLNVRVSIKSASLSRFGVSLVLRLVIGVTCFLTVYVGF
jgi:hypothetical protein